MSTGRREVCLDCDRWPCVCEYDYLEKDDQDKQSEDESSEDEE